MSYIASVVRWKKMVKRKGVGNLSELAGQKAE
jgi:hypothetical protein